MLFLVLDILPSKACHCQKCMKEFNNGSLTSTKGSERNTHTHTPHTPQFKERNIWNTSSKGESKKFRRVSEKWWG